MRLFNKQSFYNEPTTILIYVNLFHAEALRTLHSHNKDTAFLEGGLYHGCKEAQPNIRNSLYVKSGDKQNDCRCRLADAFSQFQMISNSVYLDPELTAAHLFNTKSTHVTDIKQLNSLKRNIRSRKKANTKQPYMMMPDDANSDDDSQDESGDKKAETKTFTKGSFKEPMERLSTALDKLRFKLKKIQAKFLFFLTKF